MKRYGARTAYFVKHPRRLEDLRCPHLLEKEQAYEVCARVYLTGIEYRNFLTDMLADRQFIADNGDCCSEGTPMRCLMVCEAGRTDGVLILPEHGCYVKMAAYVHDTGDTDAKDS